MVDPSRNAPSCDKPSRSKYARGCPCDACREANRVYMAKHRLRQGKTPLGPRVKRTPSEPKGSSFKKELSDTYVMTSTREQYLRNREAPPIHFLGAA